MKAVEGQNPSESSAAKRQTRRKRLFLINDARCLSKDGHASRNAR
jgi:hypothetical protein